MQIKNVKNKKYIYVFAIIAAIIISLGLSSCSKEILDSNVIGKWKLIEAFPTPIREGISIYIDINESQRVSIDFVFSPEYLENLKKEDSDFSPDKLIITGNCTTDKGFILMRIDKNNAIDEYIDSRFFNRGVQYTIEDDILTLNISDLYREIYQKVEN